MAYYFNLDDNGKLNITQDSFSNWANAGALPADLQQYMIEYNRAGQQYEQQYQLQKDAFEANLQNQQFQQQLASDTFALNKDNLAFQQGLQQESFDFNKAMAERQQSLQEESYRNGVINQASQLSALGINPASQGSISSGPSVSGGSSVSAGSVSGMPGQGAGSGVNPGNVSGRAAGQIQRMQQMLPMFATMMQYANAKKQADIAEYNAKTSRISALANAKKVDSDILVNQSNIGVNESVIRANDARTEFQKLQSGSYKYADDVLKAAGLSSELLKAFNSVSVSSAVASGVAVAWYNLSQSNEGESDDHEMKIALANSERIDKLPESKRNAVYSWFDSHRSVDISGAPYIMSSVLSEIEDPDTDRWEVYAILDSAFGVR